MVTASKSMLHPLRRLVMAAGAVAAVLTLMMPATQSFAAPQHAIAMHGAPELPAGFTHFTYANPGAPKGGQLVESILGTFDSLNPFIVQGLPAKSLRGYVFESLMTRNEDEPFTLYGLLARSIETDADRTFATFHLDPAAKFSDGRRVTADDIVFSWRLLRDHGRPNYRTYYAKARSAVAVDAETVRFDLAGSNDRELPLILALMPVLPQHAIDPAAFEKSTLDRPIGSGPYVIASIDPGRSVTFKRNPDYWGRDLAVNRGLWNFDTIRTDYYRDANSEFEAFKAGLVDVRLETDPGRWQTGYNFPAARDGRVVKETFPTRTPKPLSAFVFNTRRPLFADIRVRQAIAMLFDFEWLNRNFFFGLYKRSAGYFDDSELSSIGRSADARERALLAPYPDAVRPKVMAGTWRPQKSDGSGRDRHVLRRALTLLHAAGYEIKDDRLRSVRTGAPLTFEVLVDNRDDQRLALAFEESLRRAGIEVRVRMIDAVQFEARRQSYDFDMIHYIWDESLSPGNEQNFYWSSAAADKPGTRNYMGMKSTAADAMIAAMLRARGRDEFVAAVRALDRVLISGRYVVPLFYRPGQWVARWTRLRHPAQPAATGYVPEAWWATSGKVR